MEEDKWNEWALSLKKTSMLINTVKNSHFCTPQLYAKDVMQNTRPKKQAAPSVLQ